MKWRVKGYRDLIVWQRSMDLVEEVYLLTKLLPDEEKFGLVSQLRRCAVSIPSNIAEGKARSTRREYARFLQISYASSAELGTQIEILERTKLVDAITLKRANSLLDETMRMLRRLIQRLQPRTSNL